MISDDLRKAIYLSAFKGNLSVQKEDDSSVDKFLNILLTSRNIDKKEMFSTFNMGIGFVVVVRDEDCDKTLEELNKIANKYVFITIFGPENKKIEKDFENEIGIKTEDFPDYNYFFNIMFNLGIYANIERFDLNNYREYDSIDEAAGNGKFRTDLYNDNEKELLKEYLKRVLTYNEETEKYYNVKDKADWILIWWKQ